MKKIPEIILITIIVSLVLSGCAELETGIEQPVDISYHPQGINNPSSPNFHGKIIQENNWQMKDCQQCHSAAYSGGVAEASCITCHTAPGGPESCNTCHGVFGNPNRIAPPEDMNGNTSTDAVGVGAHAQHLYDNNIGKAVLCATCHEVPQRVYEPGHLDDDLPAEVMLKELAVFSGGENSAYNPADATCSGTYCHGSFVFYRDSAIAQNRFAYTEDRMVGIDNTVDWTKVDGSEIQCGSCHGLPPQGHIDVPLSACYQCHGDVVDQQGNIINKELHINGLKNARGF